MVQKNNKKGKDNINVLFVSIFSTPKKRFAPTQRRDKTPLEDTQRETAQTPYSTPDARTKTRKFYNDDPKPLLLGHLTKQTFL